MPYLNNLPTTPTRWKMILDSAGDSPEARQALNELVKTYHDPIVAEFRDLVELSVLPAGFPNDADDLANSFILSKFIERPIGARLGAEGERGPGARFRPYLKVAIRNYFFTGLRDAKRLRGGGQFQHVDLAEIANMQGSARQPPDEFDLACLKMHLNAAETAMRAICGADWIHLREFVLRESKLTDDAKNQVAVALNLTPSAVETLVNTIKRKYKVRFKQSVRDSCGSDESYAEEMRYLQALASGA